MKAIINARIFDYNSYIENGYLLYDEKIVEVGPMDKFIDKGYKIEDAMGNLLIPTFVCAHAHIYSIFARGLILPFNPHNFQEILDQMWWKIDAKIDNEITYYSGIAASYEFLLNGVTSVIDHHASGDDIRGSLTSLKKALVNVAKLRAILCFETSDRYLVSDAISENIKFYKKYHDSHVAGLFGMHASMSISDKTLKRIKKIQGDAPLHIHVAESKMDEDDSLSKYNSRIIQRLDKYGIITKDSLIVHGVFLDESELDIIKSHDAYMVVNTTSNMNNAVGLPNVKAYLDKGIKVMVGNDGLSSNVANELNGVLFTSHLKNESPTTLNVGDVLKMINNSYEYVSRRLNIRLGKFAKGYEADFMLVPYSPFTSMDETNAFGHIFYGLYPALKPRNVYVNGIKQVNNYKVINRRLVSEFSKCHEFADKLWAKVKEEK